MAKVTIKNTARGLRGVHTDDAGLVYIEPGATAEVEVSGGNLKGAREKTYFEFDGKADSDDSEPEGDALDGMKVSELDKIIADEGVAVPETGSGSDGGVVKADKVAAIRANREAKAAADSDDGLADMDDETLRTTVQALTGEEPAADASRDDLLAAARNAAA